MIKKKTILIISISLIVLVACFFLISPRYGVDILNLEEENSPGFIAAVSEDPSDNRTIGYEYINAEVLHFWNDKDDYYLNMSSSIQFTNHYNQHWTHNIFCAGYKTTQWNYKCSDDLPINMTVYSDNSTYVRINGTRIVTIAGRDIEMGVDYYLTLGDDFLSITPSLEHLSGAPITTDLAFAWRADNIQMDNSVENDVLYVNDSWYDLSDDLDLMFTNMSRVITKDNYTWNGNCDFSCFIDPSNESCVDCFNVSSYNKTQYLPFYILRDRSTINLRWNKNLNYFLQVKNNSQYNAPVTLAIVTTGLNPGQTKKTSFLWKDPSGLSDTFTDDDGTDLPDHVADGVNWTVTASIVDGANDIQNNTVDVSSWRNEFWESNSPENCSEIVAVGTPGDTIWAAYVGVFMNDTNNRGYNAVLSTPVSGDWTRIVLNQDGTYQTLTVLSPPIDKSINHTILINLTQIAPTFVTIEVYVDGALEITYNDTGSPFSGGNSGMGTLTNVGSGQQVLDDWNDCYTTPAGGGEPAEACAVSIDATTIYVPTGCEYYCNSSIETLNISECTPISNP